LDEIRGEVMRETGHGQRRSKRRRMARDARTVAVTYYHDYLG